MAPVFLVPSPFSVVGGAMGYKNFEVQKKYFFLIAPQQGVRPAVKIISPPPKGVRKMVEYISVDGCGATLLCHAICLQC